MRLCCRLVLAAVALVALFSPAALAQAKTPFPVGYLEIAGDARYERPRSYAGIEVRPRHRPFDGARAALRGSRVVGRALGVKLSLARVAATDVAALKAAFDRLHLEKGVRFFLVDAPAAVLTALAEHAKDAEALLFNVSEPADTLRADACSANLLHTIPSHAMQADALAQYLKYRGWNGVLLLQGPLDEDRTISQAFQASAAKFGLDIEDLRDFVLSNDPRERDKNNITLLTSGGDYEVVFVADTLGHFGRLAPYQTALPRPIVGTEGLVARTWHWAWERHGAPQLNQRFEKRIGRRMLDRDWAAWIAFRAIVESLSRTRSTDFKTVAAYLKSEELTLDGYKGTPSSFRPWNNQLRQPILLGTHNAVIERAPIDGFLHPTENMDTLGFDRNERKCDLKSDG